MSYVCSQFFRFVLPRNPTVLDATTVSEAGAYSRIIPFDHPIFFFRTLVAHEKAHVSVLQSTSLYLVMLVCMMTDGRKSRGYRQTWYWEQKIGSQSKARGTRCWCYTQLQQYLRWIELHTIYTMKEERHHRSFLPFTWCLPLLESHMYNCPPSQFERIQSPSLLKSTDVTWPTHKQSIGRSIHPEFFSTDDMYVISCLVSLVVIYASFLCSSVCPLLCHAVPTLNCERGSTYLQVLTQFIMFHMELGAAGAVARHVTSAWLPPVPRIRNASAYHTTHPLPLIILSSEYIATNTYLEMNKPGIVIAMTL